MYIGVFALIHVVARDCDFHRRLCRPAGPRPGGRLGARVASREGCVQRNDRKWKFRFRRRASAHQETDRRAPFATFPPRKAETVTISLVGPARLVSAAPSRPTTAASTGSARCDHLASSTDGLTTFALAARPPPRSRSVGRSVGRRVQPTGRRNTGPLRSSVVTHRTSCFRSSRESGRGTCHARKRTLADVRGWVFWLFSYVG